jgi:zinc D-Ala-D-Ala carboxypeptidase
MQLSPNFTLNEMTRSETADLHGYAEQYTPPQKVISNLQRLCVRVLEPLRAKLCTHFGREIAIHVTSGYRCDRVNKKVGGAFNSQHTIGDAVDIQVHEMTVEELFQFIRKNIGEYDQLIQEFDQWVHVSFTAVDNRNMDLKAKKVNGRTKYTAA